MQNIPLKIAKALVLQIRPDAKCNYARSLPSECKMFNIMSNGECLTPTEPKSGYYTQTYAWKAALAYLK